MIVSNMSETAVASHPEGGQRGERTARVVEGIRPMDSRDLWAYGATPVIHSSSLYTSVCTVLGNALFELLSIGIMS